MSGVSIADLKLQKRWTLWRLEPGPDGKPTKPPYSPGGFKHDITNPDNLKTYAELEPLVANGFSGLGFALGTFDGVSVWGVDVDKGCDRATGKFSPAVRQAVIDLDTYGEFSPSGTGCHVVGLGKLPIEAGHKREVLVRPFPGAKQIEIKGLGFYFTFTGLHLAKTPALLMDRQTEILALYDRVLKMPKAAKEHDGLVVTVSLTEEERFQKLWAGDMSAYNDDHSTADFALCILLAKKYGCNAFKIDTEFRKSGLYRDKWDRDDYRENTITKAVLAVAKDEPVLLDADDEDVLEDDSVTDFLIENSEPGKDGFFPFGEVNCIAGPSGAGKTAVMLPALEHARLGDPIWGYPTKKPREYRILLHDRSKKAMMRTAKALHLCDAAKQRIIRLSRNAQKANPAVILDQAIKQHPGVDVFFIEGLDLWVPDMSKMEKVAPVIDDLQRVAYRANICLIASVGAPKQKGKDRYFGRDSMFGSSALARKVETVALMALHDETDQNSVRHCLVLARTSKAISLYFHWTDQGLMQTVEPEPKDKEDNSALGRITAIVQQAFKQDEPIVYKDNLGASTTFYRWKPWALKRGLVFESGGKLFLSPTGVKWGETPGQE